MWETITSSLDYCSKRWLCEHLSIMFTTLRPFTGVIEANHFQKCPIA